MPCRLSESLSHCLQCNLQSCHYVSVTCSLFLHTHSKLVTSQLNSTVNNRQFHLKNQAYSAVTGVTGLKLDTRASTCYFNLVSRDGILERGLASHQCSGLGSIAEIHVYTDCSWSHDLTSNNNQLNYILNISYYLIYMWLTEICFHCRHILTIFSKRQALN